MVQKQEDTDAWIHKDENTQRQEAPTQKLRNTETWAQTRRQATWILDEGGTEAKGHRHMGTQRQGQAQTRSSNSEPKKHRTVKETIKKTQRGVKTSRRIDTDEEIQRYIHIETHIRKKNPTEKRK